MPPRRPDDTLEQAKRVASRYAGDVIPLGQRRTPKVPQATIGGRKYNLSTNSGPIMGDLADDLTPEGVGGARIVKMPAGADKWKYLWAYNTDRQELVMWRASDGDEKYSTRANSAQALIVQLDKKGQLNRLDHKEFQELERGMRKAYEANLKALQAYWEEVKGDWQRTVDAEALKLYTKQVKPKVERAVADVRAGITPIGFKPHSHDNKERQMVIHVITKVLMQDFTEDALWKHLEKQGLDPEGEGKDLQAPQWAVGDLRDKIIREYL